MVRPMAAVTDQTQAIVAALHYPGWHESTPAKDHGTRLAERRYDPIPPELKPWPNDIGWFLMTVMGQRQ